MIKYMKGKENVVVNALSWMYVLLNTIIIKLLGFQNIKELYHDDIEFCTIYEAYEVSAAWWVFA